MIRIRSIVLLAALLPMLGGAALASVASPTTGTPINLKLGASFSIKLKNAGGCSFSYTATADAPGFVEFSSTEGTLVTGATIELTALKVGTTMVTLDTMDGNCPPATHTYPVTVAYDEKLILKAFGTYTKAASTELKADIKAGFSQYSSALKQLSVEYKNDDLNDDELHDEFHDAADVLRRGIYASGWEAYTSVLLGGSTLLADNSLAFGEAPIELFAGGCGLFDTFQDGVCSSFAKYHDSFDKASKKGITGFTKVGALPMGQWSLLPPLYSGGPIFPTQTGSAFTPPPVLGPLTITTRPASAKGNNGRLRVSGMGDTARTGQLVLTLTHTLDGDPPTITTLMPTIADDEWTATFSDLPEGTHILDMRYTGDTYGVTLPLHIAHSF